MSTSEIRFFAYVGGTAYVFKTQGNGNAGFNLPDAFCFHEYSVGYVVYNTLQLKMVLQSFPLKLSREHLITNATNVEIFVISQ
eukprot:7328060-Ditylum_brightwellii.AAC.1